MCSSSCAVYRVRCLLVTMHICRLLFGVSCCRLMSCVIACCCVVFVIIVIVVDCVVSAFRVAWLLIVCNGLCGV